MEEKKKTIKKRKGFMLYLDDAAESYSQLASLPPERALPLLRAICQRFFLVMREEMYFRQMSQ